MIANMAWSIRYLHYQYKVVLSDYQIQFEGKQVPYSSRAVDQGFCMFVLLSRLAIKRQPIDMIHLCEIITDLKVAYQNFPEQRSMIPSSLMVYLEQIFEHYQFLECLIDVGRSISEGAVLQALQKFPLKRSSALQGCELEYFKIARVSAPCCQRRKGIETP